MARRAAYFGIFVLSAVNSAATKPKLPPDVTVYVEAEEALVSYPAKQIAASLFRTVGVEVAWHSGKPKPAPAGLTLLVRLAAETPPATYPGALAVAYPFAGIARQITVFYDRVRSIAVSTRTPEHVLLAHVLVHEITHAIERIDRHSDSGIMKQHWTVEDYAAMPTLRLPFAPDDVEWIRRGLLAVHE
jgi:hypothetical protein